MSESPSNQVASTEPLNLSAATTTSALTAARPLTESGQGLRLNGEGKGPTISVYGLAGHTNFLGSNGKAVSNINPNDPASYSSHYHAEANYHGPLSGGYPRTATLVGDDGQLNRPFDPAGAVTAAVTWPVAAMGPGVVHAGVALGKQQSPSGRTNQHVAGTVAYTIPVAEKTTVSLGAEIGRNRGFKHAISGEAFGEVCHNISKSIAVCGKVSAIPMHYHVAETPVGTEFALQGPGSKAVTVNANHQVIAVNPAEPLTPPTIRGASAIALNKYIGVKASF